MSIPERCSRVRAMAERCEVGMASPEELRRVQRHLSECTACARWARASEAWLRFFRLAAWTEPPEGYWETMTARTVERAVHRTRPGRAIGWIAAAAALLLLALGLWMVRVPNSPEEGSWTSWEWLEPEPMTATATTPSWAARQSAPQPQKRAADAGVVPVVLIRPDSRPPTTPPVVPAVSEAPPLSPAGELLPISPEAVEISWKIPAHGLSSPLLASAVVGPVRGWSRRGTRYAETQQPYGLESVLRRVGEVAPIRLPGGLEGPTP